MSEAFWMVSYAVVLIVTMAAEGVTSKCRLRGAAQTR